MKVVCDDKIRTVSLKGLHASSIPAVFASLAGRLPETCLFILNDNEEAGYFYHDLTQLLGMDNVLFFPSAYRRNVKYGQRDAANDILRTEVLSRVKEMKKNIPHPTTLFIVTFPEALSELVVSNKHLDDRTISVGVGEEKDIVEMEKAMRTFGFKEVDYVYEPGQFAVRGSILDVYSFSNEYPYRIDFFGDEVDSIRTFEVQTQLSREKVDRMSIVPESSPRR